LETDKNKDNTSRALKFLEKEGYARKLGDWRVHEYFSDIRIEEKGREFIDSFVIPIKNALSDTRQLEEMSTLYLQPLMDDSSLYSSVARATTTLYANASPWINSKSRKERYEKILSLIQRDRLVTSELIAKELSISPTHSRILLRELSKQERITFSENENAEKVYSLRSQK